MTDRLHTASDASFRGDFGAQLLRAKPIKTHSFRLFGKRVIFSDDPGDANKTSSEFFATSLHATHLAKEDPYTGKRRIKDEIDLGSGLVTNVAMIALANDFAWAQNCQTLKLANQHATGIGTTPAAATDVIMGNTTGAPALVAGTQTLVSAANLQKYQTTATTNYVSGLAITEWGLMTDSVLSATTGTPFTNTSATSGTVTGTPLTASSASVQGSQQHIIIAGTTASYLLVLSNTTSAFTGPAWYKTADGTAGTTPGTTEAFTIRPVMFDHKQFSAINVISGDSIAWTYLLTCTSGG